MKVSKLKEEKGFLNAKILIVFGLALTIPIVIFWSFLVERRTLTFMYCPG
jgi:hypothetical protein